MNPGEKLHKYTIVRELGRGGMGGVYIADEEGTDRQVAIKTLFKRFANEDAYVRRFQREAQVYRQLDHPNIVRFIESGFDNGTYFIVLEYVRGKPLHEILQAVRRLDPATALKIVIALAEALKNAHDKGVVHRDLKPSNVIIDDAGTVKLLDFGVAHKDDRLVETQEGTVVGTYYYAAPEQNQGKTEIDNRTDLYTLGILFYELLAGQRPFEGDLLEVAQQQARESYRPLEDIVQGIPAFLPPLVRKMMAKNPEARYQNAGELLDDLRGALGALAGRGRPTVQHHQETVAAAAPPAAYQAMPGPQAAPASPYQAAFVPPPAQVPPPPVTPPPGTTSTGRGELDTRWIAAREAFQKHQLDQAQALIEEVLKSDPNFAGGHALLGKIHAAKGFSYNAIEAFKRATALVPTDVNVHMDFAMALYSMKLPEKAREAFEAVLRLDPKNMLANRYLTLLSQMAPAAAAMPRPMPVQAPAAGGFGQAPAYAPQVPYPAAPPAQDPAADLAGRRQRFLEGLGPTPGAVGGDGGGGGSLLSRLDNVVNVSVPAPSPRQAYPPVPSVPPVAQPVMAPVMPVQQAYMPPPTTPQPYAAPVSVPPGRGHVPMDPPGLKQRTPEYIPPPKPIGMEDEVEDQGEAAPAGARFGEKKRRRHDDEDDEVAIDPDRASTLGMLWWGLGAFYVGQRGRALWLSLLELFFVGLAALPFYPTTATFMERGTVSLVAIANWFEELGLTGTGGGLYNFLHDMHNSGWTVTLTQAMHTYGMPICLGVGGLGFIWFELGLPGDFVRKAQFANLKGKILEVRRDMTLKISLGEERGVRVGMVFEVQKRKHVDALSQLNFKTMMVAPEVFGIGLAKVVSTTPQFSICKFKRTPGQSSNPSNGDRIVVVKDPGDAD